MYFDLNVCFTLNRKKSPLRKAKKAHEKIVFAYSVLRTLKKCLESTRVQSKHAYSECVRLTASVICSSPEEQLLVCKNGGLKRFRSAAPPTEHCVHCVSFTRCLSTKKPHSKQKNHFRTVLVLHSILLVVQSL